MSTQVVLTIDELPDALPLMRETIAIRLEHIAQLVRAGHNSETITREITGAIIALPYVNVPV